MQNNLIKVIDVALNALGVNKFCYISEDKEFYYITGCGDKGELMIGLVPVMVNKKTLECKSCSLDNPRFFAPKKEVSVPQEKRSIYIDFDIVLEKSYKES